MLRIISSVLYDYIWWRYSSPYLSFYSTHSAGHSLTPPWGCCLPWWPQQPIICLHLNPLVLCILFILHQLNLMSSFTAMYCIYIDSPTSGTVQTISNYSVFNKPERFKMRYKAVALTEHTVTAILHHYYHFSLDASFDPCDVCWIGYVSKWSLLAHINCRNIRLYLYNVTSNCWPFYVSREPILTASVKRAWLTMTI